MRVAECGDRVWSAIAHPAYIAFQIFWVVAVVIRWRVAGPSVRRQMIWLVSAATGAARRDTPTSRGRLGDRARSAHCGVLGADLLSRTAPDWTGISTDLGRAVADAFAAPRVTVWMGHGELHAVGVWPETDDDIVPHDRRLGEGD